MTNTSMSLFSCQDSKKGFDGAALQGFEEGSWASLRWPSDFYHTAQVHWYRSGIWSQVNDRGLTPLQDENFLQFVLDHGGEAYINKPIDHLGNTPLMVAIRTENLAIVKHLLLLGASVEQKNTKGETPLYAAVKSQNQKIFKVLLDFNAPADDGKAIIEAAKNPNPRMAKAMLARGCQVNKPDEYGVTVIQRLIRDGGSAISPQFRLIVAAEKRPIKVGPHVSQRKVDECLAESQFPSLAGHKIDEFAYPFTVARVDCNTAIKMKNGKILFLKNTDAKNVYLYLHARRQQVQGTAGELPNVNELTVHLHKTHAFGELDCGYCDFGDSFHESFGFYPKEVMRDTTQPDLPELPVDLMRMKLPINMRELLRGGYVMLQPQLGDIGLESKYLDRANRENSIKVTFIITDEQAKAAFDYKRRVEKACRLGTADGTYDLTGLWRGVEASQRKKEVGNCVDFTAKLAGAGGVSGHFADYLPSEDFTEALGSPNANKAILYAGYSSSHFDPVEKTLTVGTTLALGLVIYKMGKGFFSWRPVQQTLGAVCAIASAVFNSLQTEEAPAKTPETRKRH